MPEYLSPGVYVEELNLRTTVIPGIATFAFGFVIGVAICVAADRLRHSTHAR
jgi:phage tail sheath protein FI